MMSGTSKTAIKVNNIKGDITSKDLPIFNLLKMKETEKTILRLVNSIEKYPSLYPSKYEPEYKEKKEDKRTSLYP